MGCRALVEREGLAAEAEQLRARLAATEASAAAKQQVAELWQRKHSGLEGQASWAGAFFVWPSGRSAAPAPSPVCMLWQVMAQTPPA